MKKFKNINWVSILENTIIVLILLVLVQTFVDEISIIKNWSVKVRNILLYTGFIFDLIFTIEFSVRLYLASKKKKIKYYLFYERGWVDFLASFPLLFLNSGPSLIINLFNISIVTTEGAGFLNILKIAKAIRITRILRLLRTLKIFGKIKNADSKMATRHISTICTLAVSTIILFLMVDSILNGIFDLPGTAQLSRNAIKNAEDNLKTLIIQYPNPEERNQYIYRLFQNNNFIINIHYKGDLILSNIMDMHNYFKETDFIKSDIKDYTILFSMKEYYKINAMQNIKYFILIILIVITFMTIYSRHFVQTITDVIFVMIRGFAESGYRNEVKITKEYKKDDIYILAKLYNIKWLAFKDRVLSNQKIYQETKLTMDDFLK